MSEEPTNHSEEPVEDGDDAELTNLPRQHDSGLADLEKVTDYVEEAEINANASANAANLFDHQKNLETKQAKEKELAKVTLKKEDVELLAREMEISKTTAEKKLREHRGNLKETLRALLAV